MVMNYICISQFTVHCVSNEIFYRLQPFVSVDIRLYSGRDPFLQVIIIVGYIEVPTYVFKVKLLLL